ncbi:PREDICTED: tubulin epsilon chain-like [Polistes canadensis]|uniref:tubulin epsilon chain-like n=1 Tax=Polistes canadensis TaxID=91411 RepID=UPI000718F9DA|nr:PREDICTED: tubulin epsilon chain-like [Polistes canadensis]
MSQFITIQVGQCGNQIGSAFWPLALHEYGIQMKNGFADLLKIQRDYIKNIDALWDGFNSFFHVPGNTDNLCFKTIADLNVAKVKARAILIDMEDSVVGRFQHGPLRELFNKTCTVTNYPGSANNWATGYYTHGTEYHDRIEDVIRQCVEKCDCLGGFFLLHSVGGGTGSGLGTATLTMLNDNYPHVDRHVSSIYPTGMEDVITAPYNTLLATKELIEHATCVFPAENEALLKICETQIRNKDNMDQANFNALCLPFQDMNSIIVNMLLHLTSGSRFPGNLNIDVSDLSTNLVPYKRMHYILSSVRPVALTAPKLLVTNTSKAQDILFTNAWSRTNQLTKIHPLQTGSVILSAACIGRGQFSITGIKRNIERLQSKAKFTSWSKNSMKIGLCSVPPPGHATSLLCLFNTSAISLMFTNLIGQFTKLYKRKAHVHHYTQVSGFEDSQFLHSKEMISDLCEHYMELQNQKQRHISRLLTL